MQWWLPKGAAWQAGDKAAGITAPYGAQQKAGVQAAIEDVNKSGKLKGITLELVLEDDATSKEQGIAVFQRFINRDFLNGRSLSRFEAI